MFSKFKIIIVVLIVAVAAFFAYDDFQKYHDKTFRIIFFNVGQGDSALIKFRDGEKMLVDCGPNNAVLSRLGNYLSFFDRTIDYLVVTHPDLDHYGGCAEVVKRYHIKNILENGDRSKTDDYFKEWDRVAEASGAKREVVKDFSNWVLASSTIQWLYPNSNVAPDKIDSNNSSIVFKLTSSGGASFMFTGDAEVPLEEALIKNYCATDENDSPLTPLLIRGGQASTTPSPLPTGQAGPPPRGGGIVVSPLISKEGVGGDLVCPALKSDYLKVGHHGSDSSTGADWIDVVAPKTAMISVGKNSFGHPSLRILRNLLRSGARILRTDEVGDIQVKF